MDAYVTDIELQLQEFERAARSLRVLVRTAVRVEHVRRQIRGSQRSARLLYDRLVARYNWQIEAPTQTVRALWREVTEFFPTDRTEHDIALAYIFAYRGGLRPHLGRAPSSDIVLSVIYAAGITSCRT